MNTNQLPIQYDNTLFYKQWAPKFTFGCTCAVHRRRKKRCFSEQTSKFCSVDDFNSTRMAIAQNQTNGPQCGIALKCSTNRRKFVWKTNEELICRRIIMQRVGKTRDFAKQECYCDANEKFNYRSTI